MSTRAEFIKGHGTENDFILLPDPDGTVGQYLGGQTVRRLTDRYSGIGGDGLIRIVRTVDVPEAEDQADAAEWFMDYRNADGTVAEMCGNGVRVMAKYLFEHGFADGSSLTLATRGGARIVHAEPDGQYTVEMGTAREMTGAGAPELDSGHRWPEVTVGMNDRSWPATAVAVPNPHAVVFLDHLDGVNRTGSGEDADRADVPDPAAPGLPVTEIGALADLGMLTTVPTLSPEPVFPDGANVEFVVDRAERHIALRVWERGVGETRSCGTGVCAAAWAAMRRDGATGAAYTVDVPGGRLRVTERADGELLLTGPAELGARGSIVL
ncbi:diaminopimelate epimerase [Phytoactinopolyspora mesophila]|uniref:Diaminopimelate epimerase n=1 Tax=Phytoactinopolyspora mesophila TaxID=2650750 RepID=A0A7K3M7C6_9ACTN|nr:diaminopimelate epimerase [Phytoactinopolyspora mesophila]NDL59221.1 diaminopimelate epimerase [Phytoactinopolyspora mesophila]